MLSIQAMICNSTTKIGNKYWLILPPLQALSAHNRNNNNLILSYLYIHSQQNYVLIIVIAIIYSVSSFYKSTQI